ncbi:MAG: ATP-dependent DNA helicase RecQ [Spirulinaceae cyanobacterium SM2_1_0]|nr:ATP-dependent DNA helicase RecQ [Spirulinaceae cyanobacterium SM2_1_0]
MSTSPAADWQQVRDRFRSIWGYDDFRPPQGEIVRCLLAGRDALVVLPTGGGKSVCFQLPALLQSGLYLVVSPLVALMENQVAELQQHRLPAALLHSEVPLAQRQQTWRALEHHHLRLLYLSPETLLSPPVWQRLQRAPVSGLMLDEAHCLVQWGETFRPAYRRLGAVRAALAGDRTMAIAAFTATAAPAAQATITQVLGLRRPQRFTRSPYRPNLQLSVQTVWTPRGRRQRLRQFIQAQGGAAGLVYTRSRRDCELLAAWLNTQDHSTASYHAGLRPDERRHLEQAWLSGELSFVVATSAFGMGINKSTCRWIAHFQAPLLLTEYVQEIGRAGRDGQPAQALTLVSERSGWLNPEDRQRQRFFQQQRQQHYEQAARLVKALPRAGEVMAIAQQFPQGAITLSLLHSAGLLEWRDPFHYRRLDEGNAAAALRSLCTAQTQRDQATQRYWTTRQCRWQVLLDAFGFRREAAGFRCGHCDNCLRSSS